MGDPTDVAAHVSPLVVSPRNMSLTGEERGPTNNLINIIWYGYWTFPGLVYLIFSFILNEK